MRAEYLKELKNFSSNELVLDAKENHHLVKVARIKIGEQLKLLDGQGFEVICQIENISKKEIILTKISEKTHIRFFNIDLAVCINKKDQMDLIWKIATELGVRTIIPVASEFSVADFKYNERVERLLISALKQSNNPFLPEVSQVDKIDEVAYQSYDNIFCFSMQQNSVKPPSGLQSCASSLIIIGPEGGLSDAEEELLSKKDKLHFIHLPTPILRATTALAAAFGHVLTHYEKV